MMPLPMVHAICSLKFFPGRKVLSTNQSRSVIYVSGTGAFISQRSAAAALNDLLNLRRWLITLLQLNLILNELLVVLIVSVVSGVHVAADAVSSRSDIGSPLRTGQAWGCEIASTASPSLLLLHRLLGTDSIFCILIVAGGADIGSPGHSGQTRVRLRSVLAQSASGGAHRAAPYVRAGRGCQPVAAVNDAGVDAIGVISLSEYT